jgi:hypothetical protein
VSVNVDAKTTLSIKVEIVNGALSAGRFSAWCVLSNFVRSWSRFSPRATLFPSSLNLPNLPDLPGLLGLLQ